MSSENSPRRLADRHADALNKVLFDAGYSGDVVSRGAGMNAATKLLIRLFHEGVTDPVHLSMALERVVDHTRSSFTQARSINMQFGVCPLPNDRRFHAVYKAPEEPKNVVD